MGPLLPYAALQVICYSPPFFHAPSLLSFLTPPWAPPQIHPLTGTQICIIRRSLGHPPSSPSSINCILSMGCCLTLLWVVVLPLSSLMLGIVVGCCCSPLATCFFDVVVGCCSSPLITCFFDIVMGCRSSPLVICCLCLTLLWAVI